MSVGSSSGRATPEHTQDPIERKVYEAGSRSAVGAQVGPRDGTARAGTVSPTLSPQVPRTASPDLWPHTAQRATHYMNSGRGSKKTGEGGDDRVFRMWASSQAGPPLTLPRASSSLREPKGISPALSNCTPVTHHHNVQSPSITKKRDLKNSTFFSL